MADFFMTVKIVLSLLLILNARQDDNLYYKVILV